MSNRFAKFLKDSCVLKNPYLNNDLAFDHCRCSFIRSPKLKVLLATDFDGTPKKKKPNPRYRVEMEGLLRVLVLGGSGATGRVCSAHGSDPLNSTFLVPHTSPHCEFESWGSGEHWTQSL